MADMIRRFVPNKIASLGADECEITIATRALALDHDIWDMSGADLSHFEAHPILLFNHDARHPVARASNIQRSTDKITARATFAPPGISPMADEVRGLVKSGILTGISAGIIPVESEPLDRSNYGGRRITRWKLLEASFVSVPADQDAAVTARRAGAAAAHMPSHPSSPRLSAPGQTQRANLAIRRRNIFELKLWPIWLAGVEAGLDGRDLENYCRRRLDAAQLRLSPAAREDLDFRRRRADALALRRPPC